MISGYSCDSVNELNAIVSKQSVYYSLLNISPLTLA